MENYSPYPLEIPEERAMRAGWAPLRCGATSNRFRCVADEADEAFRVGYDDGTVAAEGGGGPDGDGVGVRIVPDLLARSTVHGDQVASGTARVQHTVLIQ